MRREAERLAENLFQEWKREKEDEIREDAIRRSTSTILGRVGEQLAPILISAEYGIDPRDMRFIGTPIDFIAFQGLSGENVEKIIFIEVKSGKSKTLTSRERKVRECIENKRIEYLLIHIPSEIEKYIQKK